MIRYPAGIVAQSSLLGTLLTLYVTLSYLHLFRRYQDKM